MRRSLSHFAARLSLIGAVLGIGTLVSLSASADAKVEADAKKLQTDAMDVDFLSLDLKSAKAKLDKAIKMCGGGKCSGPVIAGLQRDLGIVLINNKDKSGGQKAFEAAFAADASVSIGKDFLANADVSKAWEAAKKSGAAAPPPTETATTTAPTSTGTKPPPSGGNAEGNLEVKVKQAPTGYQLPVIVEMPEGLDVDVVKLSYKTTAMEKYKTLEAKKDAGKFYVLIGCEDTQFVGDIKFYVRAYDADKNEVEHYGTLKKPGVIKLVDKMPEDVEAPQLPGGKDPEKCVEKGDCQPGFPCDKSANKKPQGSGCDEDSECETGLSCVENANGKKWCYDVGGGGGGGGKPAGAAHKLWIGADLQQDVLFIGQAEDICNQNTWACSKGGQDVGVKPEQGISLQKPVTDKDGNALPGQGGKTSGGPARATTRAFISADYFVTPAISIGARLGYAFVGGNPTTNAKFMPFHAEARISYFLKTEPKGARPYLFLSGGLGEYDALVPSIVAVPSPASHDKADDPTGCSQATGTDGAGNAVPYTADSSTCRVTNIDSYRLAGQSFIAPGGGVWIHTSEKVVLNIAGKILLPLPTFSPGFALELGFKFGL
ncbi:MAG: hypothetical protein ACXVEF_01265 [Polyangiales bacterium]